MKLFNSLTRKIEPIQPINPPELGFYSCGFTVYDYAHLGHLRRYTLDDVLLRVLRHAGFKVKLVQNVTDVGHLASDADTGEDKMEKGAKKYQTTVWELAKKFENFYFDSMRQMGNIKPDVVCRATEYIPEQLELVKKLEVQGFTYVIEGDGVYFDTSKFAGYGQLFSQDKTQLRMGARVKPASGKRHPTDFALWKFERPSENRAMVWPSPWHERSFPGWHVECSAMSMKYLGEQFDLHTGGVDHLTIHHPNEIAQSEAATGKKPFVKYWAHHNYLRIEGQKMSKSLNNFFTINDVIARGFHPLALRLLFLLAHYRSEMNFTWNNLAGAAKSYRKLINLMVEYQDQELARVAGEPTTLPKAAQKYQDQFFTFLADDLKTPQAARVLWAVVDSKLKPAVKQTLLLDFNQVLGLGLERAAEIASKLDQPALDPAKLPTQAKSLFDARTQARQNQDWSQADQLRAQLQALGYQVTDTDQGQTIAKLK